MKATPLIFKALREAGLAEGKALGAALEVETALRSAGLVDPLAQMVSVAKVSEKLGRSVKWVRQRMDAGDFGAVFLDSGGLMVCESGVVAYLEAHRVTSKSELAVELPTDPAGRFTARKECAAV